MSHILHQIKEKEKKKDSIGGNLISILPPSSKKGNK